MISIKEYAESRGVSYEAVRKQVTKNKEHFAEHISYRGRTMLFDEYVIEFLDSKRSMKGSTIVVNSSKPNEELEARIKALEAENKALLLEVANVTKQLSEAQKEAIEALKQYNELLLTSGEDENKEPEPKQKDNVFVRIINAIKNK